MKSRRWRTIHLFLLFLTLVSVGCAGREQPDSAARTPQNHPSIIFMTDFGTANDAVAICKAVILQILPEARIMDITHQVIPYSIEEGARFLAGVTPYYPPGTVFLVVIDPGVGTSRKAIVAKSKKQQFFVLPDNGLITPVADRDGIDSAREITNPAWMIGQKVSSTFHGRDIFSPTAAHLAAGEDWTAVGPEIKDLVRVQPRVATIDNRGIRGEVIGLDDPYGSLITAISGEDFKKLGYVIGDKVTLTIAQRPYTMPYVKTFMDVGVGQPLLYIDSRGHVGIALNERDFSKTYKISPPVAICVPRKKT
jgi:S-adenosylmethionine hydrolase